MNQNLAVIELLTLTKNARPFGNSEGKKVFRKLMDYIESQSSSQVFCISLAGIEATDASFPRESVIAVAKQLRGEKYFYLRALTNRDLIDNWSYAARAKDQPLVIWNGSDFEIIGPEMTQSTRDLVEYILRKGSVSTSQVASDLGLSVPNASTRLKNLVLSGYIRRTEDVAESGGIEYKYSPIK